MEVYLEGGNHLRRSMSGFLRRAAGFNIALNTLPCRDQGRAIRLFGRASSPDSLLLIDSDGQDLDHLRDVVGARTGLSNAPDRIFFMVQLMEAWFLADRKCLETYYGASFRGSQLPSNANPESVPKADVMNGLRNATRDVSKGAYHKSDHAPDLLELLNPATVYNVCPNFALLINHLREHAAS